MNRTTALIAGLLMAAPIISGGCGAAQQPFKFGRDEDFAHYNKVATQIEYPNVADCPCDSAIACPSPELIGPDMQPAYWDLKLEEAMQMGLAKSRVMHDLGGTVLRSPPNVRTIADPAIIDTDARYGVEAALSEFDAVFHSRYDYQRNDRFVNNVFFGGGTRELRQDTDIFRSEITKTAATGSTFGFAHNTVYDHNNSPGNLFPSAWDTNFEATWRQPLLQGAGVEFNRIAGPKGTPGNLNGVLIARVNTDISLADFEIGLRDLVSNIENAYWDLYFAYRDLDAKIAARDQALESWRKTHALYIAERRGGEAEKEAEAREQYFGFQEEVQNAWSGRLYEPTETNNGSGGGTFRAIGGVRVAERRLRFLLGLPMSDGRLIRTADEPSLAKVVYNWDEVLPDAINSRPELRRQRWTIKRDELALVASRNFLLPKFDSFALYRIRGFGRDLKDGMDNTPENSAFQDLNSGRHDEWEAGLELTVPLGERQGHAAVRNAQLLISRDRAILDDQERQVVLDVSNAVAEVDRAYQVAQTAFNRRMAAKADVASTRAAYESDKAPLDLYLEAQRRVATAESQFFAALVEYALAIKNLHYAKGSLLDYNEIYLAEGPWPGKAYKDAANRKATRWQPKPLNYIFNQPPPVSIGTEPNYQLLPPVGPIGPPPGPAIGPAPPGIGQPPTMGPPPGIGPAPEELPKAPPPVGPQARPMAEPRPQPVGPSLSDPPLIPPPTRSTGSPNTFEFAGSNKGRSQPVAPIVQPAKPLQQQPPEANHPSGDHPVAEFARIPAQPISNAPDALRLAHSIQPPRQDRPADDHPVAEFTRIPTQPITPPSDALRAASPNQPPRQDRPAIDHSAAYFERIPTQPIASAPEAPHAVPSTQPVPSPQPPRQDRPADDRQRAGEPAANNLNWLPPQRSNTPTAGRWQIPAAQPQSPMGEPPHSSVVHQAATTPAEMKSAADRPATGDRAFDAKEPGESIYVSSVRRMNPFRGPDSPPASAAIATLPEMRPVSANGDGGSRLAAPSSAPANDLRHSSYPAEAKPDRKPWPVSSDAPTGPAVRTTSYFDGGDRQRATQTSSMRPIAIDVQPMTRPLPPISATQALPPTTATQPLPPIDGSTDRWPAMR